jgi:hypothetical protein
MNTSEFRMSSGYIKFEIASEDSLERLSRVIDELEADKTADEPRSDAEWLKLFTDEELRSFWWPTPAQIKEWEAFQDSSPLSLKNSRDMPSPPWNFYAMIDRIFDGEYTLEGIKRLSATEAQLEFSPEAFPYGGTQPLRVLIRTFGHTIVGCDDGTTAGYISGDPQPPCWHPKGGVDV